VEVRRNDDGDAAAVREAGHDGILISPGPGRPEGAGLSEEIIRQMGGSVPILGVCLGHQSLARVAGARIVRAPEPMHGKTSLIHHDGRGLFQGVPSPFRATRYHSLVVDPASIPESLEVSATTDRGVVMGLRRRGGGEPPLEGVQFHPESILTLGGMALLANFLHWARAGWEDGVRPDPGSPAGGTGRSIIVAEPESSRIGPGFRGRGIEP
jgi:anthranilate synthase/aminodeoxychorismate synthase-like glutamine amidotransferase